MPEFIGSVSAKGQITLPQEMRRKLGISPGDKVRMTIEDEKIVLRPTEISLLAGYRSITALKPPLRIEDIDQIVADFVVDEWMEKERRSR